MASGTINISMTKELIEALKKIAELEIALDAAILQCNALQQEIESLEEENNVLKQAMDTIQEDWE